MGWYQVDTVKELPEENPPVGAYAVVAGTQWYVRRGISQQWEPLDKPPEWLSRSKSHDPLAIFRGNEVVLPNEEPGPTGSNGATQEESVATATKGKKKATAKKEEGAASKNGGRSRGNLEENVLAVVEDFEAGKIEVPEGKTFTPHLIAKVVTENTGKKASTGAVTNVLKKWDEAGFILTHDKPYAYKAISARGKKEGYAKLMEKLAEKRKAERAKKKEEGK